MRKQYSFWPGERGLDAWDVDRLIALSAGLPVVDLPLTDVWQLDEDYWYDHGYVPTVRSIADHLLLVQAADLSWPVLIGPDGRVLDGMHRIVRALTEGRPSVPARRFAVLPKPDFRDCRPGELPY